MFLKEICFEHLIYSIPSAIVHLLRRPCTLLVQQLSWTRSEDFGYPEDDPNSDVNTTIHLNGNSQQCEHYRKHCSDIKFLQKKVLQIVAVLDEHEASYVLTRV